VASNHWGLAAAVVIEAEEREGGVLAGWPRAPPLLFDAKQIGQGVDPGQDLLLGFAKICY
jgi:hypothetical protein